VTELIAVYRSSTTNTTSIYIAYIDTKIEVWQHAHYLSVSIATPPTLVPEDTVHLCVCVRALMKHVHRCASGCAPADRAPLSLALGTPRELVRCYGVNNWQPPMSYSTAEVCPATACVHALRPVVMR
jgi:hypothetical protein